MYILVLSMAKALFQPLFCFELTPEGAASTEEDSILPTQTTRLQSLRDICACVKQVGCINFWHDMR